MSSITGITKYSVLDYGVLRVIVGQERERVTEECMMSSVMFGTVRVSS